MAARLMTALNLRDAARTASIAVPDVSPTTYDWFSRVQRLEVREIIGDFGRDPSEATIELVAGCEPVVASPVYFRRRRVVWATYDDGSHEEWRIVRFDRELSGETPPRLVLRPLWLDLAAHPSARTFGDGAVTYTWYRIGVSVSTALTAIMQDAPAPFAAGTVDAVFSGVTVSVVAIGSTHLELLRQLCAEVARQTGGTCEWDVRWDAGSGTYKVDLVPFVGGTLDHPIQGGTGGGLASEGNRQRLMKTEDAQQYFSRVVGLAGPDGEQITIGQASWAVSGAAYSAPNTTLTLGDDPIYVTNSPGVTGVQVGNATQGWFDVVSTQTPDQVVVSGDASALNGQQGRFRLSTGAELTYVSDPGAEASSGAVTHSLVRSDIPPARNLLTAAGITADFSTWSGGLPVGWNASAVTVTEETDERYVQAGTKSARVSGNAQGVFYSNGVTFTPTTLSPYLSTWIAVRVLSGRIRLEVQDIGNGYLYPLNSKDKADAEGDVVRGLAIGGLTPLGGSHRVRITCLKASTVFVVDSVTLTQSPVPYEYVPDMGPEALFHACMAKLALDGGIQPDQLEGEWFDLSYLDGATTDEASIGAKVQVKDAERGGSFTVDTETRLVELTRQYHQEGYVKRGRLGSRAIDVTAFLSDHLRRRVLTEQDSPSMRAEFDGLTIGFDDAGYVLLSWSGNGPFYRGYVNVGVDTAPSAPSSSTKDGTLFGRSGVLKFDGSGGTLHKAAAMGQYVHVKAVAENTLGIVTTDYVVERKRRRGDMQYQPPTFQVKAARTGTTVTITISGQDPSASMTGWDFTYKLPNAAGGYSTATNSTAWSSNTWSSGARVFSSGLDITVPAGVSGDIYFRATHRDELGQSREKGFTVHLSDIDELTKTIIIPGGQFTPADDGDTWNRRSWSGGVYAPGATGAHPVYSEYGATAPVVLPDAVVIRNIWAYGIRATSSDVLELTLWQTNRGGGSSIGGGVVGSWLVFGSSGSWQYVANPANPINYTLNFAADVWLSLFAKLKAAASTADAQLGFVKIEYTAYSYARTY